MQKEKNTQTFIGCDSDFESADIVIFGAPFDGTTTYRPGARFAPAKIRSESYGIETYSPYQDKDLGGTKVFDAGDLELPFGNTERVIDIIENTTTEILDSKKFPLMLGGEHLVTLGTLRAIIKKYPDVVVVHFDAHTDLRDEYFGEKLSHSTVMRRVFDMVGPKRIYQFGIRSGEREEFEFAKRNTFLVKNNFEGLAKLIKGIGKKPVYFTIDLDVLDPSAFGGTGTPEAGGVTFLELLESAKKIFGDLNIIGCDINELSPPYDTNGASTALACKFLREVLLLVK